MKRFEGLLKLRVLDLLWECFIPCNHRRGKASVLSTPDLGVSILYRLGPVLGPRDQSLTYTNKRWESGQVIREVE